MHSGGIVRSQVVMDQQLTRQSPLQQRLKVGDVLQTSHHFHLHLSFFLFTESIYDLSQNRGKARFWSPTFEVKKKKKVVQNPLTLTRSYLSEPVDGVKDQSTEELPLSFR